VLNNIPVIQFWDKKRRNFSRSLMPVPALENISVFLPTFNTLIKDFYRHLNKAAI